MTERRSYAVHLLAVALLASFAGACSLVVDASAEQCSSDADCSQFPGSVCDSAGHVCVADETQINSGGTSSAGGSSASASDCGGTNKDDLPVEDDINRSETWSCRYNYVLKKIVRVNAGATLTIPAGTTVKADAGKPLPDYVEPGTLMISPGAKLRAVGTKERPIVFTSSGDKRPGQWGGVILLGNATVNQGTAAIEGVTSGGEYGGTDDEDSSGALQYVRIEYAGFSLNSGKEINGLTLGGVGRRTSIDHVQVRRSADDCFEFFGGTVDAKYLACQGNEDDGFDFDFGYRGRLQYLLLQQDGSYANVDDAMNGIEADNEAQALTEQDLHQPRTAPTIYNMTLCGQGERTPEDAGAKERFGMLWRRNSLGEVHNSVIMGFEAGVDVRDALTSVSIDSSIFFDNVWGVPTTGNVAYPEDLDGVGVTSDDDGGFDEAGVFEASNSTSDPAIADCFSKTAPDFSPVAMLTDGAAEPPADGFFDAVSYLGAVSDSSDTWWSEPWLVWSDR